MQDSYVEILRRHSQPIDPQPTGESSVLGKLSGIRAVLFDIYGTLVVSASGDVGTLNRPGRGEAFVEALRSVGLQFSQPGDAGVACFVETIERAHRLARDHGIEFPEVEIRDVWRETLRRLAEQGALAPEDAEVDFARLAIEYEARVNPVWPMPGVRECLENLRASGITLGIVSNAQAFTRLLFPALLDASLEELGFDPILQYYSFEHGEAKPSERLYRLAAEELSGRGIGSAHIIYVGNDMLNDIWPASKLGFRTALFAGDARSLRRRDGDSRVASVTPDLVLTDLPSLCACLEVGDSPERN